MRKDTGTVHFFLNGVDLGPAAYEVPDRVFGIIGMLRNICSFLLFNDWVFYITLEGKFGIA